MSEPSAARRIGIHGPLGFSAGLPLLLTGQTLAAWLATENISLKAIGAFALVSLPYNLKWLWAPLLDRYRLPFLDRRRGWMILFQLLLGVTIAALGATDPEANVWNMAFLAIVVATLSASQDVIIDAYRTDELGAHERGKGAAAYITGYRIANIAAGTGSLIMADYIAWRYVYWIQAGLMFLCVFATLAAPSPPAIAPPKSLRSAVLEPLGEFFRRRGALIAITFIMLYKIGDYVAAQMVIPFLLRDLHFELTEVALLQKFLGLGAIAIGAAVGGVAADRIGSRRALLTFGVAQAVANIGYVFLAWTGKSYAGLVAAISIDNFCNGMGAAAFVAYLMSLCHHQFSATQYALLSSASTVVARLLTATSGWIIDGVGWAGFFASTIVIASPALLLWKWLPYGSGEGEEEEKREPRPVRGVYRALAGGAALAFAATSVWKFTAGDWKLGIGLAVPTLAFGAYALVTGAHRR